MAGAVAGAGVGADVMDKGEAGAGAENKQFQLRNTALYSKSILHCTYQKMREIFICMKAVNFRLPQFVGYHFGIMK